MPLRYTIITKEETEEWAKGKEWRKLLRKLMKLKKQERVFVRLTDITKLAIAKAIKENRNVSVSLALDKICREWLTYRETLGKPDKMPNMGSEKLDKLIEKVEKIEKNLEEIRREMKIRLRGK